MGLLERLRGWRKGAVTGLNATENNIKMTGACLAPFLVMWFVIKLFFPEEMYDLSVTIAMLIWLVWIVMLYSYCKSDAGNFIVFPQSKWKFPDGTCKTFDIKIPPDSWEKVVEFPDGSCGYKVYFDNKYFYDSPDLPFPIVFDRAYWLTPTEWDISFKRRAFGEFFHKGVYVTKPDCEDISLYVVQFEPQREGMAPVCIINDCAFAYEKTLKTMKLPELIKSYNPWAALYRDTRKKLISLLSHSAYLEDSLDVASKETSEDFKKSADRRLKSIRARHGDIMDVKPPLLSRIFNLKTLAFAIIIVVAVFIFGRVVMNWW